jgi:hypothetical protein
MTHSPASASGDQPPAGPGLTARDPTAGDLTAGDLTARLAADGELTAEDIAALARLDDGSPAGGGFCDEDPRPGTGGGFCDEDPDPGAGGGSCDEDPRPDRDGEAPTGRPAPPGDEHSALVDADTGTPRVTEALDAGFTRKYAGPGATGFASGSLLDVMLPGRDLAWHAASARRRGLATLSDNELCGVMGAARRLESWAAGLRLATVNELDTRRAGPGGRPGEHVAEEVGAVLILTPRAADDELGLARNLARVPQTRALLSAGILDQARAEVIADALAVLDPVGAATVENLITPRAADLTTGQLRAACERAIKAYDPQAATRRREKAQRDARVECWAEAAGTSAIAGRDLVPAGVIAADKTLDADARWLRTHGMPGSHDERRAAAFLARLTNRPLTALLPAADAAPEADSSAATSGNPATGTGAATGTPASGTGPAAAPSTNSADTAGTNPAAPPSTGPTDTPGTNPAAPPSSSPTDTPGTNPAGSPTTSPAAPLGTSPADTPGTNPAATGWVGGLGGTVNLTMPAAAWLGLSDAPGEAGGPGALDADTCRDLAAALAANPATRWCVTIVDRQGRATAHGCARQGPGPPVARDGPGPPVVRDGPGPPVVRDGPRPPGGTDPAAWLATVKISPIETGACSHRRESAGYQPSNSLRHIIKIRSPRCGFPGCRRPAIRCDDDHTIPYDKGGRTCECNLHPLCRRHHQAKQASGWRLEQPEPGVLIWHLPHGRSYTVRPEPYPV